MNIYINKKEIEAIRNAWLQINDALEGCSGDEDIIRMKEILNYLNDIDKKYKKNYGNSL